MNRLTLPPLEMCPECGTPLDGQPEECPLCGEDLAMVREKALDKAHWAKVYEAAEGGMAVVDKGGRRGR